MISFVIYAEFKNDIYKSSTEVLAVLIYVFKICYDALFLNNTRRNDIIIHSSKMISTSTQMNYYQSHHMFFKYIILYIKLTVDEIISLYIVQECYLEVLKRRINLSHVFQMCYVLFLNITRRYDIIP